MAAASNNSVTVRTPEAGRLRDLLLATADTPVTSTAPDELQVDGLTAEEIGTIAWKAQIPSSGSLPSRHHWKKPS